MTRREMLVGLGGILATGTCPAVLNNVPLCRVGNLNTKPYDAEVEYLETHRKSWIDTGIFPKVGCTFYFDHYVENTQFSYGQFIFGCTLSDYFYGDNWLNRPPIYAGKSATRESYLSVGRHYVKMDKNGVYVDGTLQKTYDAGTVNATSSLLLGTTQGKEYYGARTFYGKIFSFGYDDENGNEVMRLIPVRVGDVGKFYDTISCQLFESKDEPYIIGPDK